VGLCWVVVEQLPQGFCLCKGLLNMIRWLYHAYVHLLPTTACGLHAPCGSQGSASEVEKLLGACRSVPLGVQMHSVHIVCQEHCGDHTTLCSVFSPEKSSWRHLVTASRRLPKPFPKLGLSLGQRQHARAKLYNNHTLAWFCVRCV
jgi:hypothetical protein